MEKRRFQILFDPEQIKELDKKARASGFHHKSDYIKFILFMELSLSEKINAIYNKIIKNE
jgi:hypothetical protein